MLRHTSIMAGLLFLAFCAASSASAQEVQLTVEYLEFDIGEEPKTAPGRELTADEFIKAFSDKAVAKPPESTLLDRLDELQRTAKKTRHITLQKSLTSKEAFDLTKREKGLRFHAEGQLRLAEKGKRLLKVKTNWGEKEHDSGEIATELSPRPGQPFVLGGLEEDRHSPSDVPARRRTARYVVVRIDEK